MFPNIKRFFPATSWHAILSLLGALLVLVFSGILLSPLFHGQQSYNDIYASSLTYGNTYKNGDYYYIFLLVAFTLGSFFLFGELCRIMDPDPKSKPTRDVNSNVSLLFSKLQDMVVVYFAQAGLLAVIGFFQGQISISLMGQALLVVASLIFSFFPKVLPWAKLCVPFLLFRFLHLRILGVSAYGASFMSPNFFFQALLLAGLLFSLLVTYREIIIRKRSALLPLQNCIIAAFVAYRIPSGSTFSTVNYDSYHIGEMLIPFRQLFHFHQTFFSEFVSVHGYMAVFFGFFHRIFFDGTYATLPMAISLYDSFFAALMAASVGLVVEPGAALFLVLFILPSWNRFYLFPILLGILAAPKTQKNPISWILLAAFLAIIALLYDHAPGFGMVLAISPCIFVQLYALNWKERKKALLGLTLICGIFSLPIYHAFQFIAENGPGTVEAFGFPLSAAHRAPSVLQGIAVLAKFTNFFGEAFKNFKLYGWIVACLCLFTIISWHKSLSRSQFFIVAFSVVFFCALMPYTFGRIGTDGLDRAGALSLLALGTALPIAFFIERKTISIFGIFLLCLCVLLRSFPYLKDFQSPITVASAAMRLPLGVEKLPIEVDSPKGLGGVIAMKSEVELQKEFGRAMATFDPRREGYLDLTNQQSYYFIHDRPSRYIYPSLLLAINEKIQKRIISELNRHPPLLVWLAPAHDHEFFKVSLRAYRVYRWLIERGYTALVQSDKGNFYFLRQEKSEGLHVGSHVAPFASELINKDLGLLPIAWGRNWSRLLPRFKENNHMQPTQFGPNFVNFVLDKTISGLNNDFILLKLRGYRGKISIEFEDKSGRFASSEFLSDSKDAQAFLLPIGADPRWLYSNALDSIKLLFATQPNQQNDVTISFLHLDH